MQSMLILIVTTEHTVGHKKGVNWFLSISLPNIDQFKKKL